MSGKSIKEDRKGKRDRIWVGINAGWLKQESNMF